MQVLIKQQHLSDHQLSQILNASLSNWSIHSEILSPEAVKQLYSNGHVRNIKNLPSVTVGTPGTAPAIEAWWQLNDSTNPGQDLIKNSHLQYYESTWNNQHYVTIYWNNLYHKEEITEKQRKLLIVLADMPKSEQNKYVIIEDELVEAPTNKKTHQITVNR